MRYRTTGKRTKNQWLELNGDVATSFAVRYRGLPALMGGAVKWDASHLFEYEALLEAASKRKKYKRNVSTSRASLQIKFDITLKVGDGALARSHDGATHLDGTSGRHRFGAAR